MKDGVRRRGKNGGWEYTVDLGMQPAQRCNNADCNMRFWLARRPLAACPKCGGQLRDTSERRQQTQGGFKTQSAAKRARVDALHDLGQGTHVVRDNITLREYLQDEWLPSLEIGRLRPSTRAGYRSHVKHHFACTPLGAVPLQKLSREKIAAHYAQLMKEGRCDGEDKPLSASTLRRIHATLHRALRDAVRSRLIPVNPADDIELPSVQRKEQPVWSADQLLQFLTVIKDDTLASLWLLIATTGMRRGEALGLRWADLDLDLDASKLTIRRALSEVDRRIIEGEPKTAKGRRTIALDPVTVDVLRRHRTHQKIKRMAEGAKWRETDIVFASDDWDWLRPNRVSTAFKAAVKRSGLPTLSLHCLRHTWATIALVERGFPAPVISARLGHANVSTTLDIYSHAMSRQDEEAALDVAGVVIPKGF